VIKREINRRLIHECRCDERLKVKVEGSARLMFIIRGKGRVTENIYRWVSV
jgi:hypothetical protein